MTSTERDLRLLALQIFTGTVVAVAAIACIAYLIVGLQWRSNVFAGFNMAFPLVVDGNRSFSEDATEPVVDPETGEIILSAEWAGLAAGLQRRDQIVQVNDVDLSTYIETKRYRNARNVFQNTVALQSYGDTIQLEFLRPVEAERQTGSVVCDESSISNGFIRCSVEYTLAPVPASDFLTFFIFPFITGLVALVIGVALMFLRPNQPSALLITLLCVSLAVFSAGVFNNSTSYFMMPLWYIATTLAGCVAFLIALGFPTRPVFVHRYPLVLAAPPLASVLALGVTLYLFYNLPAPETFTAVWGMPVGFAITGFVAVLVSLLLRRRFTVSTVYRDQINTSLIGVGIAALPILLWLLSTVAVITGSEVVLPFNSATIMPFFISIPISMAYAVLQYRGFNSDQVLSQGITYILMMAGLIAGYSLLVFGVNLLVREFAPEGIAADSAFLVGLVIFIVAVAFLPVRSRLQNQIDRIYFRERRQFQETLEDFSVEVAATQSFVEILSLYVERVQTAISSRGVFIFLPDEESGEFAAHHTSNPDTDVRFSMKSDMVALLAQNPLPIRVEGASVWVKELIPERTRLNILKANLIIPLQGTRDTINGFVVLGPPHSYHGEYRHEEIRFVENISRQMAISVERSRVVESLQRRVSELDVLSQVSQAVNFAVEFDDLLELISAQTQKLIETTHFYIALRETSTNQMYYAFFLELNERHRNRENSRWMMGNDLFSRILENTQPERHDDYRGSVTALNLDPRGVDEEVSAWMGVPLIAGATYLGVMAVGTLRSGFVYTDEQLKIFNDIGALAATSLDKARLFEEANERARQLRALNDISRQLQAERDIERLLTLVTSSAVNILDAEAGSLLLTVDNDEIPDPKNRDLEFRVVVGGSGQELIGQRVKAGHGLVGQVAREGKPVIVNNTREDTRWEGEVTTDDSFHTDAVLAVPLMANNTVIGVLEVLNKRDGGLYVNEDAEVLDIFAGQAAIAIENVRLFQKTDEQLDARVQELETLERIDAELNRALDMRRVADITIKWAVANSGASAAALGLITEDEPPMLEVLKSYGYEETDLPEGATERYWPLDKGIAGRVLRTRRADTQTDFSNDQDYVPSLRGSNSQITIPMLAGGELIAMLILEKNTEPRLNILDQLFAQRLADHAAIALENARLYGELSQANKVQSDMMGIGAHELKNALTPIRGFVDLVKAMGNVNEKQTDFLETIKRNTDRASLIITDLRDFAADRANELDVSPEPVSIRHIVIETLRPFTAQIEEKEQILDNQIIHKDLPDIYGDPNRLIQVMTNFVSNANKYSPNGSTITLDARVVEGKRDGTGKLPGDLLHITVADNGIGISKEDQKNMFKEYFRSTNDEAKTQPGTGLGMYLTRKLILQHGGEVWLESELGKGTTFHFTIPLAPKEETASEPASD
ncbi:MAG: GAF domain-containing protein [Chloroflexota bacterium]